MRRRGERISGERGFFRKTARKDGSVRWEVYSGSAPCSVPCPHKECTRGHKRKVYVGSYATEQEAAEARREFDLRQRMPSAAVGPPIRLRVIGIYSNGAERELTAVDVLPGADTYDSGIGFTTADEEFCVFVARRPRLAQQGPSETCATVLVSGNRCPHPPHGASPWCDFCATFHHTGNEQHNNGVPF